MTPLLLPGAVLSSAPGNPALPLPQEAPPSQDILVFLTGQEEIEATSKICRDIARHLPDGCPSLLVLPLYASLPYAQQLRVFQGAPKVRAPPSWAPGGSHADVRAGRPLSGAGGGRAGTRTAAPPKSNTDRPRSPTTLGTGCHAGHCAHPAWIPRMPCVHPAYAPPTPCVRPAHTASPTAELTR